MSVLLLNRILNDRRKGRMWIALVPLVTVTTRGAAVSRAVDNVGILADAMPVRTGLMGSRAGLIGVSIKPVGPIGDGVKPVVIVTMGVANECFSLSQ